MKDSGDDDDDDDDDDDSVGGSVSGAADDDEEEEEEERSVTKMSRLTCVILGASRDSGHPRQAKLWFKRIV
ncbi:hypothetical protein ElyMa_002344200 [Elysia marginata]|uniref:Uncharacterized protein n=1 Tax=Elysia marginata TaxID=1093978 RepID=A0AAV4G7E6_9GAST|nr:hypothetical protein ElyMa_002344200 [Elysia marginata]